MKKNLNNFIIIIIHLILIIVITESTQAGINAGLISYRQLLIGIFFTLGVLPSSYGIMQSMTQIEKLDKHK